MSKTVAQIFALNPTTVVADTDLYYLVQSPYTPGTDAAITGASLKAAFGTGGTINPGLINQLGFYAANGSTISGLTTANNGVLVTSGAGVPSISSTLPSAVQTNITALGAQSQALNMNTHQINNLSAGVAATDAANVGQVTAASSPLTTKGDLYTFTTVNARLPVAVGDGKILQVSSGAATGLAYSTPTYPSASGSTGVLVRSDGTNNLYTTTTYPNTNAINTLLYASAANVMSALATANNGLLVTGPTTGTPSILAGPGTTGNMLISNAAAAPSFTTFTYPTTVGASGSIHISNGTNIVSSTSLWPNTVGTSGKVVISDGTSNVYSTPTFPNASATTRKIIVSDGTNWVASTETYAVPGTSGNVLTSNGTNWTSATPTSSAGRLLGMQAFTSSGTYTPTAGTNTAIVRLVGGGGGGAGSGTTTTGGTGGTGGTTSVGAVVSATGGVGGTALGAGGTGGVGSSGTVNLVGGGGGSLNVTSTTYTTGAVGGNSAFGGGGGGPAISSVGVAGGTNTGGGGSGASGNGGTVNPGSGGGAGGYAQLYWTGVTSQTITIGAAGTAGTAGTSGSIGGAGAKGLVIIEEYS